MTNDQKPARGPYADVAPALDDITQRVLFGDVWERPGLSKRDRSLVTVATLIAGYRTNELPFHMKRALENGGTQDGRAGSGGAGWGNSPRPPRSRGGGRPPAPPSALRARSSRKPRRQSPDI